MGGQDWRDTELSDHPHGISTDTACCYKTQTFSSLSSKFSFCLLSRELASSSNLLLTFPSPFPSSVKARLELFYTLFSMSRSPRQASICSCIKWCLCGVFFDCICQPLCFPVCRGWHQTKPPFKPTLSSYLSNKVQIRIQSSTSVEFPEEIAQNARLGEICIPALHLNPISRENKTKQSNILFLVKIPCKD